jgi:hypothetical protein
MLYIEKHQLALPLRHMKISIRMLTLGSLELNFLFDRYHQPAIDVEGTIYTSLGSLCRHIPQFSEDQHLEKLAQVANFLVKGLEFDYIEDIELFKEDYAQQLEAEQLQMLNEEPHFNQGVYDLSEMHPPRVVNHRLVFFVKQEDPMIPYRVSLDYPVCTEMPIVLYEALALLK